MELEERLRTQWTEAVQDWIETDQTVRSGFLDTWMLDALGDVSGKSVIDIGCGEGRFSRLLSELDATVTGIDLTEPLIEQARRVGSKRETYLVGDAETLEGVSDESFDLAVSYIVLVDLLDYRKSIREAYRVLRPGGSFVVCNVHPMRTASKSIVGWIRDSSGKLFYPVDNYTEEGEREFLWWGAPFINMHRTISSYVSAFLDVGFVLEALQEPIPSEEQLVENPKFDDELRVPNFIIYVLKKPT
ncbi:MAG: class I SAM-dependent methyltransferase [Dehalococcoidia bacterium]|nr:class I SAM-dependent methyltransferase [Dehalococcoidia bacterium]